MENVLLLNITFFMYKMENTLYLMGLLWRTRDKAGKGTGSGQSIWHRDGSKNGHNTRGTNRVVALIPFFINDVDVVIAGIIMQNKA